MKAYFERLMSILNTALMSIDDSAFTELIDDCENTIRNGGKIIASGLGKNEPICVKFIGTLTSLGMPAAFMNTNSAAHGDIGMVTEKDLVIILTKSGATVESIYLYEHLLKRGCTNWLLSFEKKSPLADVMDKKLIMELEHEGDMWNIVPNNSTTLNLIVLQMLSMRLAKRMDITLEMFRENHPGGHIGEVLNG